MFSADSSAERLVDAKEDGELLPGAGTPYDDAGNADQSEDIEDTENTGGTEEPEASADFRVPRRDLVVKPSVADDPVDFDDVVVSPLPEKLALPDLGEIAPFASLITKAPSVGEHAPPPS